MEWLGTIADLIPMGLAHWPSVAWICSYTPPLRRDPILIAIVAAVIGAGGTSVIVHC